MRHFYHPLFTQWPYVHKLTFLSVQCEIICGFPSAGNVIKLKTRFHLSQDETGLQKLAHREEKVVMQRLGLPGNTTIAVITPLSSSIPPPSKVLRGLSHGERERTLNIKAQRNDFLDIRSVGLLHAPCALARRSCPAPRTPTPP